MGKSRLLIVEDIIDISHMTQVYFDGMGLEIDVAVRGSDVLEKAKQILPNLILLDIMLPDIDGFEVLRELRANARTRHIPVVFWSQKDERSDKLHGLELGADDYITKPFDIEELKLRVLGAIKRSERESLTDPCSGRPAGRLIEDHLRRIICEKGWALLDARVNNFEPFKDVYGFVTGDDVLCFTSILIGEVVDELGATSDFIGHAGGDNFIIITSDEKSAAIKARLKERFDAEVLTHYNFMDRQQGFMQAPTADGSTIKVPFMTMSVGIVSPSVHSFADIREITELAAEARRQDKALSSRKFEKSFLKGITENGWDYLQININHFKAFQENYGEPRADKVIKHTIQMIREIIWEIQNDKNFFQYNSADQFVLILPNQHSKAISERLKEQFNNDIQNHYDYVHRLNGYIRTSDHEKHPFMRLAIETVPLTTPDFADMKKIADLANNLCKRDD